MASLQTDLQETIDAHYAGRPADGLAACERLLGRRDLDSRGMVLRNQVFYAQSLAMLAPSFHARPIQVDATPGYLPTNPGLCRMSDGRLMAVVRLVNYRKPVGGGTTFMTDSDGQPIGPDQLSRRGRIRSKLLLGEIAPDAADGPFVSIDDSALPIERFDRGWSIGLEDCRITAVGERLMATCTVCHANPETVGQIAIFDLTDGYPTGPVFLSNWHHRVPEKNWMPIANGDDQLHVSWLSPTCVVRANRDDGSIQMISCHEPPAVLDDFRGGTPGVPFEDGWLFLAHSSADFEAHGRTFLHRWVWLDGDYRVGRISQPFRFHHDGIEFAAGLVRDGDDLLISYGVQDGEAWLGRVAVAEVGTLLQPIPAPRPPVAPGKAAPWRLAERTQALVSPPWSRSIDPNWILARRVDVGPMYTHADDREVGGWLRDRATWSEGERRFLTSSVMPGMRVIDVGANIGYFSIALARLVGPDGGVLAFEPEPANHALLQANVSLNQMTQVTVLPVALDREPGIANMTLSQPENRGGYRAFGNEATATARVAKFRLDDLLDPAQPVHLIKVDAEGMDHRVIEGALESIRRWRPVALVELNQEAITELGDSPLEVLRQYGAWGFTVEVLGADALRMRDEAGADLDNWLRGHLAVSGREEELAGYLPTLGTVNLVLRLP